MHCNVVCVQREMGKWAMFAHELNAYIFRPVLGMLHRQAVLHAKYMYNDFAKSLSKKTISTQVTEPLIFKHIIHYLLKKIPKYQRLS